ncbi:hypothetical protein IFM89_001652 [Coptis chinensis]|uniref:Protein kinase domain-containing protein n=1 Tax=Coptis chinensis TaxID=261450 RepID=A0A835HIL9_9MAGN|nr:hypothetical protein IFM89_001652 [Coptis chinensis]
MKIALDHVLQFFFFFSTFLHPIYSATISTNSTYYYNQCAPSTCGDSILKFPFGKSPLCSSAYITTTCENNSVYLIDEENTYIKYKLLHNLTNEVYTNTSVRLVDTSLFGCGTIPSFTGLTPNSGYEAQKWVLLGALHYTSDYRTGTFFNCTKEPDKGTLDNMMKSPCLECGETSNLCYFYDGYTDHVANCRPFRVAIPVKAFGNFSGVGNLRRVLQEGFEVEWDGDCNSCMVNGVGRCGYLNQERKSGDEYCFCNNGVHKDNCSDGVTVDLNTVGSNAPSKPHKKRIGMILGIGMGAAFLFLIASYIFYKRRHNKQIRFSGGDKQVLKRYFDGDKGTSSASIETFLQNYTSGRPTRFSYKQLKKYTNNFSHKIGQGGFGSVFKGQLPNGFIIAVKILDETTNHIETQFLNEVLTIGRIHHNHLVRLLGYCFDQSRIALVYEFLVNGSLDKYIHQKKQINNGGSKWHECNGKEEEEMAMRMELVGLWCIQFEPSKRPSMRKVVDMLEGNVAIEIPPAPFDANMSAYGYGSEIKIATEINTLSFFKSSGSGRDSST